jgi:hypothetical protein
MKVEMETNNSISRNSLGHALVAFCIFATGVCYGTDTSKALIKPSLLTNQIGRLDSAFKNHLINEAIENKKIEKRIEEISIEKKNSDADLEMQTRMAIASEKSVKYSWYGVLVGLFALIVSLAVGLFGIIQWNFARRQSRQELRAYIHTDISARKFEELNLIMRGLPKISNPPKELIYDVSFQNYGQTPAHKITVHADALIEKYPHPDATKLQGHEIHDYVAQKFDFQLSLGPTAKSNIMVMIKRKISEEEIGFMQLRNRAIYIFGQIRYLDSFGNKRHTNFRYAHRIIEPNDAFSADIDNHYGGNDAT